MMLWTRIRHSLDLSIFVEIVPDVGYKSRSTGAPEIPPQKEAAQSSQWGLSLRREDHYPCRLE